jgi:death-on-curing protein
VNEPIWVDAEEATAANHRLVAQFGGVAAGPRDENLLLAAMGRPLNKWHYADEKPSLFQLAAAYAFAIARGRVFHDGNKRTAYTVAIGFLDVNGVECAPPLEESPDTMGRLTEGALDEDGFAEWLRPHAR